VSDLHTLATKLSLPLWELEVALGIPISNDLDITTIEEAEERYRILDRFDGHHKDIARHHWNRLCEEALEKATTVDDIRRLYARSPGDEVIRGKILLKRIDLADCHEEIQAILGQSSSNLKVKLAAYEKWKELTRQTIHNAQTITEALKAFQHAPPSPSMERAALAACLEFATTPQLAKLVCLATNATSEHREEALTHWLSLASSIGELLEVRQYCFDHRDIRVKTLQKLITLLETADV
jgi:hypothetical protein